MKIQIETTSDSEVIMVRHISWKERCEEQLSQIIEQLQGIKKDLENSKNDLEGVLYEQNTKIC